MEVLLPLLPVESIPAWDLSSTGLCLTDFGRRPIWIAWLWWKNKVWGNQRSSLKIPFKAVVLAYFNVLLAQEQQGVFEEVLAASRERLKYEDFRKELGATSTFDMIQFRSAVLTDSINYVSQQLNSRNALRNLNLLMAMPPLSVNGD